MFAAVDDALSVRGKLCICDGDRPDAPRRCSHNRQHPKRGRFEPIIIRNQKLGSVSRQIEHSRLLERHHERNSISTCDGNLNDDRTLVDQGLVEIDSRTVGTQRPYAAFLLPIICQLRVTQNPWRTRSSSHCPEHHAGQQQYASQQNRVT